MRIVFATGNKNKMTEIREVYKELDCEIVSMKEAGADPDIVEDGKTFEENALIKARALAALFPDDYVMADDSGLEIDALGGEPGVYSARYMGEDTSYDIKNAELIRRLGNLEKKDRTARFVCAIALVKPGGEEHVVRGTVEGYIGYEPMGRNGFGYDPIFYLFDRDVSTASLSMEEKNELSHRGNALRMMKERLVEDTGDK